jgi:6-phosphofructokinase 1
MGSDSGYLALMSAIAGGVEVALIPEFETRPEDVLQFLETAYEQGRSHFIVVAAEGLRFRPRSYSSTSTKPKEPTRPT